MAGVGMVSIFLSNTGASPCRLDGTPDVLPLDAGGAVLTHTSADLDGDFGGSGGAVLPSAVRDAAYIPLSVTARDDSLEPCSPDHMRAIATWRVSFPTWTEPVQVSTIGELGFCDGRFRVGAVKAYERGARLTTPLLPPPPSP